MSRMLIFLFAYFVSSWLVTIFIWSRFERGCMELNNLNLIFFFFDLGNLVVMAMIRKSD